MALDLSSFSQIAISATIAIVGAAVIAMTGIMVNEERIKSLEKHQDMFEGKTILPEAEIRITAAELMLVMQGKEIDSFNEFMTEGKRCTFTDCERLKDRLDRIQESQTACLTSLATNTYRLDLLEKNMLEFIFESSK